MLGKLIRRRKPAVAMPGTGAAQDALRLSARLPSPFGREPLLSLDVELRTQQSANGERVQVRARLDGLVRPPSQRALAAPGGDGRKLPARRLGRRSAELLARLPVIRRAAEQLAGKLHSELVISATTEPRPADASALVPSRMADLGFGRQMADTHAQPLVEVLEELGHDGTQTQMGLLQVAKAHLPPELVRLLGDAPFQLSAAWLTQVTDDPDAGQA